MACPAWFELLSAGVDGELDDDALRRLDQHCALCNDCRAARRRLEDLRRRSLVRVPHDSPELAAAILVRGEASTRRRIGGRLVAVAGVTILLAGVLVAGRSLGGDDRQPPGPDRVGEPAVKVRAIDDAFESATLTVASGTTIEWENHGEHTHRLVRDLGGELVSTELVPGGTETVTFNHSGDYEYYCSIHDGMSGRILVES